MIYSWLAATTAFVAVLSFFAGRRLRVALSAVAPSAFFHLDIPISLTMALYSDRSLLLIWSTLRYAFDEIAWPFACASIGVGVGLLARAILKRPRSRHLPQ